MRLIHVWTSLAALVVLACSTFVEFPDKSGDGSTDVPDAADGTDALDTLDAPDTNLDTVIDSGDDEDASAPSLIWTHPITGDLWENQSLGEIAQGDFSFADNYCRTLSIGSYSSGWELPTIDELRTIMSDDRDACGITDPDCLSEATPCYTYSDCEEPLPSAGGPYLYSDELNYDGGGFWSASRVAGATPAERWGVDFDFASINSMGEGASSTYVRCRHAPP